MNFQIKSCCSERVFIKALSLALSTETALLSRTLDLRLELPFLVD